MIEASSKSSESRRWKQRKRRSQTVRRSWPTKRGGAVPSMMAATVALSKGALKKSIHTVKRKGGKECYIVANAIDCKM